MEIINYIKRVNECMKKVDKKAQNPFLDNDNSYNPFENAFKQTYVWIEKETDED